MKEQFGQQPENPKPNAFEAGAGPLGLPPPGSEQSPQGEGSKSPEGQPLKYGEGQGEPAEFNVNSANTVDAESPEAGLNDNAPRKLRRRRSSSIGGGRLHGCGEDEIRKQNPPPTQRRPTAMTLCYARRFLLW
jgi:hypothetical protein